MHRTLFPTLACVSLFGCRAILGIEDPPDEIASSESSTATTSPAGPQSAGVGSTGEGGAPATGSQAASSSDGAGGDITSAGGNGSVGAGGEGAGGQGAGGFGDNPLVVALEGAGLRLAYDDDEQTIYALDEAAVLWRISDDLEVRQRCLQTADWDPPDTASPGWLAAYGAAVSYSPDGEHTFPITFPQGCEVGDFFCDCDAARRESFIAGRRVRGGTFFGISSLTADFGTFAGNGYLLVPFATPGDEYDEGRHVALGPVLSYGSFQGSTYGGIFAYTSGGTVMRPLTVQGGSFLAVAAGTANDVYGWAHTTFTDEVVFCPDASSRDPQSLHLVDLQPYAGQPAIVADDHFVYVTTEEGVVICQGGDLCKVLSYGGGRIADLAVTNRALYVLEGKTLLRYDDDYLLDVFDELPSYEFEPN